MRLVRPADLVVVATAVAAVAASAYALWTPRVAAARVEIRSTSAETLILDLDSATEVNVEGRSGHTTIAIEHGRARFVDSPCRNRVCIATGWLTHVNDFAACVPNGVSMRIVGRSVRYDSINH